MGKKAWSVIGQSEAYPIILVLLQYLSVDGFMHVDHRRCHYMAILEQTTCAAVSNEVEAAGRMQWHTALNTFMFSTALMILVQSDLDPTILCSYQHASTWGWM
jgi:hypothetical protein